MELYDLYVYSSTSESFGRTLREALKAGLPIFVSDIPVF
ncbi:MAG: glycosyltransferase [Chitinophagales bacterium]|nr:glycosyltransferase [Chitinophagales bacterium]